MGSRRVGKRRVKSLIDALGFTGDEWGLVRPAAIAVPGLSREIKSVQLGQMHGFGIEDLTDLPAEDATTSLWVRDTDNSLTLMIYCILILKTKLKKYQKLSYQHHKQKVWRK